MKRLRLKLGQGDKIAADHELRHNASETEAGGYVDVYTYISRVKSPQSLCRGRSVDSSKAQAGVGPLRHKANKARGRRVEAVSVVNWSVVKMWSVS